MKELWRDIKQLWKVGGRNARLFLVFMGVVALGIVVLTIDLGVEIHRMAA